MPAPPLPSSQSFLSFDSCNTILRQPTSPSLFAELLAPSWINPSAHDRLPAILKILLQRVHPKLLCRFVAPFFAAPEYPQRLNHNQFATVPEASEGVSHSSLLVFGRSGLRPSLVRGDSPRNAPLKTTPDDRCAFFAAVRLSSSVAAANQRRFEESLNGASSEG